MRSAEVTKNSEERPVKKSKPLRTRQQALGAEAVKVRPESQRIKK